MERIDSLDKYYKPINLLDRTTSILFWLSAFLSVVLFSLDLSLFFSEIINILFIVITILYFCISSFLNIYLMPRVENMRRKHLLSNSFGFHLDTEKTVGYYNNNIDPSLIRLGANILENALFAKKVTSKMAIIERIKISVYLLLWITLILLRTTDVQLISIIGQTLFTSTLITNYLKLEFLRIENERVWDDLYNIFLSASTLDHKILVPRIIENVIRYEAAKAYSGVKQSSKIFFQINKETSVEWEEIKGKILIS